MRARSEEGDHRRLRKTRDVVEHYLDRLDHASPPVDAVNARQSDRHSYRDFGLSVDVLLNGTTWVHYEVPSRNLSSGGAALLFGHFVYPGTLCKIHLVDQRDRRFTIGARVVRCRYLEGSATVHEVGVQFAQPIDVSAFTTRSVRRYLIVDNNSASAQQLGAWLAAERVELTHVCDGREALELAGPAGFDLIVLDAGLPAMPGIEVVRGLRRDGYVRPILMTAAANAPWGRLDYLAAGADECVLKPLSRETLLRALESMHSAPHFSSCVRGGESAAETGVFVAALPGKIAELQRALCGGDYAGLLMQVRAMKAEGAAAGFQLIAGSAAELEKAIDRREAGPIGQRLRELARFCLAARSVPAEGIHVRE